MSKDSKFEHGFDTLLTEFQKYQKLYPKGVSPVKKGNRIYLQLRRVQLEN